MIDLLSGLIPSILMIVSPILITACGGMICERSGVVNIALEGLMGIGAFTAAASHALMEYSVGGSVWIALLLGAAAGAALSLIHAYASVSLNADQTISGTGINLLADGLTIFLAQVLFNADRTRPYKMGMQPGKNGVYPTFLIALAVIAIVWFILYRRPFGLHLRACGEHPQAAASVGINVKKIRYIAVAVSGLLAGLAALAAVSFGRWKPAGITGSSLLFGSAVAFSIYVVNVPSMRNLFPSEFFTLLPYVITLLALVAFSGKNYAPAANGKPYEQGAS